MAWLNYVALYENLFHLATYYQSIGLGCILGKIKVLSKNKQFTYYLLLYPNIISISTCTVKCIIYNQGA